MNKTPSDSIPSQPDERERIQQIIELAMIEEAEIQYADFADRDRQREKIITSAAAAILAMLAERRGAEPRGCPTPGACSCPPAPIAGLEPAAWRFTKLSVWHVTSERNWAEAHGDCVEPLYTRAQLEAHAAEQVRPLVEALEGLIEAVELDADEGLEGIGSYTGARLTDAKNAIRARGQV